MLHNLLTVEAVMILKKINNCAGLVGNLQKMRTNSLFLFQFQSLLVHFAAVLTFRVPPVVTYVEVNTHQ